MSSRFARLKSAFGTSPFSLMNQTKINRVSRRITLVALRTSTFSPASSGECYLTNSPEIPVGKFVEEPFVEFGGVQCLFPSAMQFDKITDVVRLVQRSKGEIE